MKQIIKKILAKIYVVGKATYENQSRIKQVKKFSEYTNYDRSVAFSKNFIFDPHVPPGKKKDIKIERNTLLDCIINYGGGKLHIGKNCSFRRGTTINCKQKVIIGNNVFTARNVFISDNNNHPTSPAQRLSMTNTEPGSPEWKFSRKEVDANPVIIEDNVWIGKDSFILKGVNIGEGSIIAANSVVTKDVKKNTIIGGNPAKQLKKLDNDL